MTSNGFRRASLSLCNPVKEAGIFRIVPSRFPANLTVGGLTRSAEQAGEQVPGTVIFAQATILFK